MQKPSPAADPSRGPQPAANASALPHRKGGILINPQFKKGALELCVLSVLEQQDCYGWDLVNRISRHIQITEGTIYPLLRRLKEDGQLTTYLQESTDGPPRKYYRITQSGLENLRTGREEWTVFARGVSALLEQKGPEPLEEGVPSERRP